MAATASRLPRYLVLQHQQYWARIRVPKDVRVAFDGKREYWEKLGEDRKVAEAHCHRAASTFWSRVREARGHAGAVEGDALAWQRRIEAADSFEAESLRGTHGPDEYAHTYEGVVADAAVMAAADLYVRGGRAAVSHRANLLHDGDEVAALKELGGAKAETFIAIALQGRKPLAPFVEPWHTVRLTEVEPKTASMDKTAVNQLISSFPLASNVTKAGVANWIERRKVEVSASTVQREVTGLRSFWKYLQAREEVSAELDPFVGQRFKDRRKDRQRVQRVDFAAAEVAALYVGALKANDRQLADLIALAAYTGARREELCALKIAEVAKGWIKITDAKTDAGNRDVPTHRAIAPTIKRLVGKRTTGYVLGDTGKDKWGNRGDALGKRFTRLKTAMGFGGDKTFHSIRHSFASLLRGKRVPEDLVADLMGHKLPNMTFAVYGGKDAARKLLPGALAKLKYPKPL